MALLALNNRMVAQQQEFRHGVVLESRRLPILLGMTGFTFFAFLSFVLIVFLVTRDTSHFQLVFIKITFVAT